VNAAELRTTDRAAIDVDEVLDLIPLSERSVRRALEPGGDLDYLALRVGRRCFVKVEPLRELLGMPSDMHDAGATTPATVSTTDESGPRHAKDNLQAV
jgi:hypothetical protein